MYPPEHPDGWLQEQPEMHRKFRNAEKPEGKLVLLRPNIHLLYISVLEDSRNRDLFRAHQPMLIGMAE